MMGQHKNENEATDIINNNNSNNSATEINELKQQKSSNDDNDIMNDKIITMDTSDDLQAHTNRSRSRSNIQVIHVDDAGEMPASPQSATTATTSIATSSSPSWRKHIHNGDAPTRAAAMLIETAIRAYVPEPPTIPLQVLHHVLQVDNHQHHPQAHGHHGVVMSGPIQLLLDLLPIHPNVDVNYHSPPSTSSTAHRTSHYNTFRQATTTGSSLGDEKKLTTTPSMSLSYGGKNSRYICSLEDLVTTLTTNRQNECLAGHHRSVDGLSQYDNINVGILSEDDIVYIIFNVTKGLLFLHSNGVTHQYDHHLPSCHHWFILFLCE
jgi:hypothetical protein